MNGRLRIAFAKLKKMQRPTKCKMCGGQPLFCAKKRWQQPQSVANQK